MKKFITISFFSIILLSFVFTLTPIATVFSADYVPLSPLPDLGTTNNISGNFSSYLTGIYKLAIGIAGVLAVIVILFEGIRHMASESFVTKSDTSARIGAAIGGLILALGAYVILYAINPKLVNFNLVLTTVPDVGRLTAPQTAQELQDMQIRQLTIQQNLLRDSLKLTDANIRTLKDEFSTNGCADTETALYDPCKSIITNLDRLQTERGTIASAGAARQRVGLGEEINLNSINTLYGNDDKGMQSIMSSLQILQKDIDKAKQFSNDPEVQKQIETTVTEINSAIKKQCEYWDSLKNGPTGFIYATFAPSKDQYCNTTLHK